MTPEQLALLSDARLSDAARVLGLHISTLGDGEHELSHDAMAALLHGCPNADTVGRHMRHLIVHGYVERTSAGGKGSPRYRWLAREFSRAENSASSSTRENSRGENGAISFARENSSPEVSARENSSPKDFLPSKIHGHTRPSSSSPSTPSTSTGAREDDLNLVRLRKLLDPLDAPLDQLMRSTGTTAWASQILGWYAPPGHEGNGGGTQWRDLSALPVDRAMSALSMAIGDYASNGEGWHPRRFRGYLRTAVSEELRKASSPDGAPKARASPHGAPPDWQDYGEGTTEFRGLNG